MEQMFDIGAFREQKDTVIPRFYIKSNIDERESKKVGHQVFVDVEMVELITPGDKLNVPHIPVSDYHRNRFAKQYEAFKKGMEQVPDGFRLEAWPHISPGACATLKAINCHTVEQLAEMAESNRPKLPDFYKLQQKAREFLDAQKDSSVVVSMQTKVEDQKTEIQHLMNTGDALKKKIAEMHADVPKLRGRPPKVP